MTPVIAIEIVLVRGRTVRPVSGACAISVGGRECGRAAGYGFSLTNRLVPACLRHIHQGEQVGAVAVVDRFKGLRPREAA